MNNPQSYEQDVFSTGEGDLTITFLGHGSLLFTFINTNFYIDPYSKVADYSKLPKAGVILLTHEHRDHLDSQAISQIQKTDTDLVISESCARELPGGIVLHNGDERTVRGVHIRAVPAYNIQHKRPEGQPFHPKGVGNGYILTMGGKRVYVAGDSENIPEMNDLEDIDIAFLPMNLPYTMTPEMVAQAAREFKPRVLYPYHFGSTDPSLLVGLLKGVPEIEVRIRKMA
jgi:L-ascorbate metabolism protein UlaG (beta-lactamase superfamily)